MTLIKLISTLLLSVLLLVLPCSLSQAAPDAQAKKITIVAPTTTIVGTKLATATSTAPVTAKASTATSTAPASQPTAAPVDPSVKQPQTPGEAVEAAKDFGSALWGHKWWLAAAMGIFIIIFGLKFLGVFAKIGTLWAWILVGGLSLAAGCFAAFNEGGFNWTTFLAYVTAGPTIAWARDFVKDGLLQRKQGG